MKKKLLAVLIALISVITLAFALPACNVSSDGRGSANNGANPGVNNDDDNENIIDKLSDITKTIETDSYYRGLGQKNTNNNYIITQDVMPIPYKFLRNHGHNVDAYLDGTLDVFASSYIYDNDKNHIYVSVKAENVSSSQYGNYYTNYVLKYPLTNQEYEDYITLSKSACIQSLFFIQELDNQKTPEMLSKVNIAKTTYEYMIKSYAKSVLNPNKYNSIEIDITNLNENMISVSLRGASLKNSYTTAIGFADLETIPDYTRVYKYDNDAYYIVDAYQVNVLKRDEYKNSLQNITSFSYGDRFTGTNPYPYSLFDNVKNK